MGSPHVKRAAVASAVLLSATVPAAQTAWAAMLAQRPLVEAAETLKMAAGHAPGFAGIQLEGNQVALYWKGVLPTTMSAAVAAAKKSAPVRVASAAHTEQELRRAAAKIRENPAVQDVKIPGDGSGVVVSLSETASASVAADVPVTVVREKALRRISRKDAAPPWPGGARTFNRTQSTICTSGFGVRNSAGSRFILTAAHCGDTGDKIDDGAGSQTIGYVGPRRADHDIELIPTSTVDGTIYVGGDGDAVTPVTGWGDVFIGELLCQGGVTSAQETGGPVCDLKVTAFLTSQDLVEATQQQGLDSARGGDSGGPVYSAGNGGVVANGTSTWTSGARFGFQDFATASADFGVDVP